MPRISVVLPVYNAGRYLKYAVESLLSQSHTDFDLLICDDHSTDATPASLAQYQRDPRVRVIYHAENRGLFPTLNQLIRETTGDMIRLWSQDDIMKPGCLAAEHAYAVARPGVGFFYTQFELIDPDGRVVGPSQPVWFPGELPPWELGQLLCVGGCVPGNIATITFRRSVYAAVGPFDEGMTITGDFDMWARMGRGHSMGVVAETLVQVRVHAGQLSRQRSSELPFIRQNLRVVRGVIDSYPSGVSRQLLWFVRRVYLPSYFQAAVRALVRGDFTQARRILSEISAWWSLAETFLYWLFTVNGRLFRPAAVIHRRVPTPVGNPADGHVTP